MLMRTLVDSAKRGELRKVLFVLVAAVAILGMIPDTGDAAVIPADETSRSADLRAENLAKVQAFLERKEVAARLSDYGLTSEEVSARLSGLSDQQVAEVASQVDRINAGGDALGIILTVLLIGLVVLVILHLLGYIDLKLPGRKKEPAK